MATTIQSWQQEHTGVPISGEGRWLVYKECVQRARRFSSYFQAKESAGSNRCGCGQRHEVIELGEPSRMGAFRKMVEMA